MNLCNEHESEICYEARNCPGCVLQKQLTAAEEKISELETEIEALKEELKNHE